MDRRGTECDDQSYAARGTPLIVGNELFRDDSFCRKAVSMGGQRDPIL